ncbi:MAG: hypothetical protein ICV71_00035 [Thermoleophilia bacterium]|nr:hypothetical protein [Thermoleophilia bacterium]
MERDALDLGLADQGRRGGGDRAGSHRPREYLVDICWHIAGRGRLKRFIERDVLQEASRLPKLGIRHVDGVEKQVGNLAVYAEGAAFGPLNGSLLLGHGLVVFYPSGDVETHGAAVDLCAALA